MRSLSIQILLLLTCASFCVAESLQSPDERLSVDFSISRDDQLVYAIFYDGEIVIGQSPLGLTVDGIDFGASVASLDLVIRSQQPPVFFEQPSEVEGIAYNRAELWVSRADGANDLIRLQLRLYNNCLAFRYEIPGYGERSVSAETTAWNIPTSATIWHRSYAERTEGIWTSSAPTPLNAGIELPVTIDLGDGPYVLITEADLRSAPTLSLASFADSSYLLAQLPDSPWKIYGSDFTPWRITVVAEDLTHIRKAETYVGLLSKGADPLIFPAAGQSHWIKPGKMISSYWTDPGSSADYATQRTFVDYATVFGYEYVFLGTGWKSGFQTEETNWFEKLNELTSYASQRERPIGLWVYEDAENLLDEESRSHLLWLYSQAGVSGIVIDTSGLEHPASQTATIVLEETLRSAGNLLIQVVLHGSHVERGQSRTFPNLIGIDGALGLDEALLQNDYKLAPAQNTIAAFTRGALGNTSAPMVSLEPQRRGATTTMHQIASAGVLDAPLMSVWEHPLTLFSQPVVRKALRQIPTEWETLVVFPQSQIGELVAIARKRLDAWYILAINGSTSEKRELVLDLDFLPAGVFDFEQFIDIDAQTIGQGEQCVLASGARLPLTLLPGGGYMGVLRKRKTENREFLMGFDSESPQEAGSEIVRLEVSSSMPWSVAANETGFSEYPAALIEHWEELRGSLDTEKELYLVASPFADGRYASLALNWGSLPDEPLESPWTEYEFSSATVKSAYSNYLAALVDFFDPEFIAVAPTANRALTDNPAEWDAIKTLLIHAQQSLRSRHPEVQIVASLSFETLIGETSAAKELQELYAESYPDVLASEPAGLLATSDVLAFSIFPALTQTSQSIDEYLTPALTFASDHDTQIAVERIAIPSKAFFVDEDQQSRDASEASQFSQIERLLEIAYERRFPFLFYSALHDSNAEAAPGREALLSVSGLKNSDGTAKPSDSLWQSFYEIPYIDLEREAKRQDQDSDGIVDAEDLAPANPNLSSIHYFYEDADKDSYGSYSKTLAVDSDVPPPNTSAWRGDPDDSSKFATPTVLPKGAREFSIGVWKDGAEWSIPERNLQELGVGLLAVELDWNRMETENGIYDGPDMGILRSAITFCRDHSLDLVLTLHTMRGNELVVPDELRLALSYQVIPWTDEFVKTRFLALLNTVLAEMGSVNLASLQLASNVQAFRPDSEAQIFWPSYKAFLDDVKSFLDANCPAPVPLGLRVSSEAWSSDIALSASARETLLAQEFVGIDYRPTDAEGGLIEPVTVVNQLSSLLNGDNETDFRIFSLGYPSSPETFSSQTKQSQFVQAVFEVWDAFAQRLPYMGFRSARDSGESPNATDAFLSVELEPKRAYQTFRTHTMNRGWWRIPGANRRSFHLGFTHTPYDAAETFDGIQQVDAWMWGRIQQTSDIVNLQLDGGIPWVEAFADDFSQDSPPYQNFVLGHWEKLKSSVPEDHKLILAFSPTGNPRSKLEAYWGYGREIAFIDDEGFVTEPIGDPKETTDAFLPSPWDKLRFNDEPVKIALVNYAKRVIEYFDPDYLLVGLEVSESIPEDPVRFDEYIELQAHLYQALKDDPDTKNVPIIVSVSSTSLMTDEYGVPYKFDQQPALSRQHQLDGLKRILPLTDILGVSHYPHFGKYNADLIPAGMYETFFDVLQELGASGKPVAITESGYAADPFTIFDTSFKGSPQKQNLYMRHLLYEMEKAPNPVEFIINYQIRDTDYTWLRQKKLADEGAFNPVFLQFFQYFRDMGIYDGDGNQSRPVYFTWTDAVQQPLVPKGVVIDEAFKANPFLVAEVRSIDDEFWISLRHRIEETSRKLEYEIEYSDLPGRWEGKTVNPREVVESLIPAADCDDTVNHMETLIRLDDELSRRFFRLTIREAASEIGE